MKFRGLEKLVLDDDARFMFFSGRFYSVNGGHERYILLVNVVEGDCRSRLGSDLNATVIVAMWEDQTSATIGEVYDVVTGDTKPYSSQRSCPSMW